MNRQSTQVTVFRCLCVCGLIVVSLAAGPLSATGLSIIAPLAGESLLLDIAAAGQKLVAVGERGHVLVSDDDGEDWQQVQVPTRSTLTGVYMLDEQYGWAVGHDAVILRTTDGALSWQRVFYDPEQERPLLDVWFADRQYGFAIGAYGFYLESTDGGNSWNERIIAEEDFHLNQVSNADGEHLIIAGEAGNIYMSSNRGRDWETLESPYHGSFFSVKILAEDIYVLAGLRGHLFKSIDGGIHWQQLESRTGDMLTDIMQAGDDDFIVVGLDGALLRQHSSGEMEYRFLQNRKGMTAIAANSRGEIFAVGEGGIEKLPLQINPPGAP